jgi:hypothetical protein
MNMDLGSITRGVIARVHGCNYLWLLSWRNKDFMLYQKLMWCLGIALINSLIAHERGLGVLIIKFFILNALFAYE